MTKEVKQIKIVKDISVTDLKKNFAKVEKDKVLITLIKGGTGYDALGDFIRLDEQVFHDECGNLCANDLDNQKVVLLKVS